MTSPLITLSVLAAVSFQDPRYDDRGTGEYVYPIGEWYERGQFDLRQLRVERDGDDVVFTVRMDQPFVKPSRIQLTEHRALNFESEIYLQNIDIYIDTSPALGETQGVPGRNVQFRPQEAWDRLIILTPQPYLVRQSIRNWKPNAQWAAPDTVRSRGQEVWVRVPASWLGGLPEESWGYQVVVTGALLEPNFEVFDRVTNARLMNALTIPVFGVAEVQAFGGGELDNRQPRAVDILDPPRRSQFNILRGWTDESFATIPMVRRSVPTPASAQRARTASGEPLPPLPKAIAPPPMPPPGTAEPPPPSAQISTKVLDVRGDLAILAPVDGPLSEFRIGEIVKDGEVIGRVVITGIFPKFVQATVVEGQKDIRVGHRIRFSDPQETP